MLNLRPYQERDIDSIKASLGRARRTLYVLPTGGGKTFIFVYIAMKMAEQGKRCLIVVHRQELLAQACLSLARMGIAHSAIAPAGQRQAIAEAEMAECGRAWLRDSAAVQVASVQTLVRRLDKLPKVDLIILDEGHHATAGSWLRLLGAFPDSFVLGVTATPCRLDGTGLGTVYNDMVQGPTVAALIKGGFLCPFRYYEPPQQAIIKRKVRGEFDPAECEAKVRTITGDVIGHYERMLKGAPTLAFCVSVAHAQSVQDSFRANGWRAKCIDGTMPDQERREAIRDLGLGRLNVLTSCEIVSEGTDIPTVHGAIMLRQTSSVGLYMQQAGRVLRPAKGKEYAVILDHVGNKRHGYPDDERTWTLDAGLVRKAKAEAQVAPGNTCPKCYLTNAPHATVCIDCGTALVRPGIQVKVQDGELVERGTGGVKLSDLTPQERKKLEILYQRDMMVARAAHRNFGGSAAMEQMFERLLLKKHLTALEQERSGRKSA